MLSKNILLSRGPFVILYVLPNYLKFFVFSLQYELLNLEYRLYLDFNTV